VLAILLQSIVNNPDISCVLVLWTTSSLQSFDHWSQKYCLKDDNDEIIHGGSRVLWGEGELSGVGTARASISLFIG